MAPTPQKVSARKPRCLRFPSARPRGLGAYTDALLYLYAPSPFCNCSNSTPNASVWPEALEGDRDPSRRDRASLGPRRRQAGSGESASLRGGDAGPRVVWGRSVAEAPKQRKPLPFRRQGRRQLIAIQGSMPASAFWPRRTRSGWSAGWRRPLPPPRSSTSRTESSREALQSRLNALRDPPIGKMRGRNGVLRGRNGAMRGHIGTMRGHIGAM